MAADTEFRYSVLSAHTLEVGSTHFTSPSSGTLLTIPGILLGPTTFGDSDGDGLQDDGEMIVGTDPDNPDTDGDRLNDRSEIQQGTNPLDGTLRQIGIIATADTPGTAVDVCLTNDLAVVADSNAGVAIFNIFNGMNPIILAQIDTPGRSQVVDCTSNRVAVGDGDSGLAIIDIEDPTLPQLLYQIDLNGRVQAVTVEGNLAYAGTASGQLVGHLPRS